MYNTSPHYDSGCVYLKRSMQVCCMHTLTCMCLIPPEDTVTLGVFFENDMCMHAIWIRLNICC